MFAPYVANALETDEQGALVLRGLAADRHLWAALFFVAGPLLRSRVLPLLQAELELGSGAFSVLEVGVVLGCVALGLLAWRFPARRTVVFDFAHRRLLVTGSMGPQRERVLATVPFDELTEVRWVQESAETPRSRWMLTTSFRGQAVYWLTLDDRGSNQNWMRALAEKTGVPGLSPAL